MRDDRHSPRQMEDELPMGKLLKVAAVALLIGALGVVAAWGEWRYVLARSQPHGPPPLPLALGAREQGLVFQPTFDQLRTAEEIAARERERLGSFGWVDRSRGLVHVPIAVAIEELIRRRGP